MSEKRNEKNLLVQYDYKEILVPSDLVSLSIDSYKSLGWNRDDNIDLVPGKNKTKVSFKRDRNILNKTELTRLERNLDACMEQIDLLKISTTKRATRLAISVGLLGTAFMAGSTFAVTNAPPIIWLSILLAIPGFAGWIFPYFIYQKEYTKEREQTQILLEEKYDEIYDICKKASLHL